MKNANPAAGSASWIGSVSGDPFAQLLQAAEARFAQDADSQAHQDEKARCAADICYWVNTYCKTYDPREDGGTLPFKLFPRQEEFLLWLQARELVQEDGLAEKCRDVGFTWLCVVYVSHGFLFRQGFAAGFGSRKENLVDKMGDMDSILEKVRFTLREIPDWQRPTGYKESAHAGFCNIRNPENGNSITGEAGDNIGRGGRKTIYIVDEHAFLARPKKVEAALSQTSRVKIRVSTPNGVGNEFYVKRHGGKIAVFTFRWLDDPRKNYYELRNPDGRVILRGRGELPKVPTGWQLVYPWYAKQCDDLDEVTVAQEIDIDYTASVEGICIPAKWVLAAVGLPLKPSGTVTAGFDVAAGGKNKNVLIPRHGPVITEIVVWGGLNTTQSAWKAADECEARGVKCLHYDGGGIGLTLAGTWSASERKLRFVTNAVNGGGATTESIWQNGKTSAELFHNRRAELYWKARTRFQKAYEYRLFLEGKEGGAWHPDDEMISIPDNPTLISQLSTPLVHTMNTGKYIIESKDDMRKRGVASPDHADALVYGEETFADWEEAATASKQSAQRHETRLPEVW